MATPGGTGDGSVLGPLRHRAFRGLTLGGTLTRCANAMAPLALAFAVLDLTGSAADVGFAVGARSVANIALVLFGGMLADRLPKALILQGASYAAAAVQAAVAAAVLTGTASLPLLIVLSVVNGGVAAVSLPAWGPLVPQTVPPEQLRAANAVSRMGGNTGVIAGASLGGAVTAALDPGWGFAANAVCFGLAGLAYRGVRVRATAAPAARPAARPWQELRDGWREFTARTWVWLVVAQFFVVNAVTAGGVQVLGPAIANSSYGRASWGLALATQTAGALLGGVLVARLRLRRALFWGVAVVVLDALPLLALSESAPLALLAAAMFVNGLALEQFGVAWEVSLQENIPADRLARVYSYDMLGSILALPAGEMSVGPLAERFGERATLLGGVCLLVAATAVSLASRQVRTLTTGPARVVAQLRPPVGQEGAQPAGAAD